ncbi:MAG: hypothetical protein AAF641_00625 [Pseudomonadota bacterium]
MSWNNCIAFVLNAAVIALWVVTARADTVVHCDPMGAPEAVKITPDAALDATCDTYTDEAGQEARMCQWTFAYRSEAAQDAFEAVQTAMDGCYPKTIPAGGDVNHPDSFNQVFYTSENARLSLSLKDKAQRQTTHLFFRIETPP